MVVVVVVVVVVLALLRILETKWVPGLANDLVVPARTCSWPFGTSGHRGIGGLPQHNILSNMKSH